MPQLGQCLAVYRAPIVCTSIHLWLWLATMHELCAAMQMHCQTEGYCLNCYGVLYLADSIAFTALITCSIALLGNAQIMSTTVRSMT